MIAALTVLSLSALPAAAEKHKGAGKDGRSKVEKSVKTRRAKDDGRSARKKRATHKDRNRSDGGRARKDSKPAKNKKKHRFVKLTSLVATVEGRSVAPDTDTQVKGIRLHRPAESSTDQASAAGATNPTPSSGEGMLDFLVAALLLASLAAWLVRQVGPLKDSDEQSSP